MKNLDIVFGETKTIAEKQEIARKSIQSFCATLFEFIAAEKLFPKAKVNYVNKKIVDDVIDNGRGIYAMCIHMSNWEYLCHINAKNYVPVHVVVKSIGKGNLALWVENLRKKIGFSIIDRKSNIPATTQIFNAIDKNEIVGFIIDQKRPRGENLPFFGKIASTNNSLTKLYLRKKAPIIPAIIKRIKPGHFEIIYFPEFIITQNPSLTFEQQVTENTQRMNSLVEQMILQNPEEYFWMHNRWNLKK